MSCGDNCVVFLLKEEISVGVNMNGKADKIFNSLSSLCSFGRL